MLNKFIEGLSEKYLFSEVRTIIKSREKVIDLSIGDVTLPLPQKICEAGIKAVSELGHLDTFRGYPPESGYDFFKQAVVSNYKEHGIDIDKGEVFISDGIKSDMNSFLWALRRGKALLPMPYYPAYLDMNVIRGNEIAFYGSLPSDGANIIIVCSPSNPSGEVITKKRLCRIIKYALLHNAVVLFDGAYEAYSNGLKSVYEVDGARKCAVEFRSLSKTAGFTGVRCGYTVVPKDCGLNTAWRRVKSCTTNGVSYITQRMAQCALTDAKTEVEKTVGYYLENARIIRNAVGQGEPSSPYVWLKVDDENKAFYSLLDNYGIGVTPGSGFGKAGKGFVRISSFCTRSQAIAVADSLKDFYINKKS